MRTTARLTAICLLSWTAALTWWLPSASAVGFSGGASGSRAPESPLVVAGVDQLLEGQQTRALGAARHASPQAVARREASRSAFRHLDAAAAKQVAEESFSELLDTPAGGPPSLGSGRITRYVSPTAARVALPDGKRGVFESSQPMAQRVSRGRFVPIDLSLRGAGDGYSPAFAPARVRIPRRLADGISMPRGLSLTPVDAQGASLAGAEGGLDGASVIYANTQTDTDTVAKPTSSGAEISAILRSPASPRRLIYRMGMPAGARLVQERGHGSVQVISGGSSLALVPAPSAQDAAGTPVPISMHVAGDELVLERQAGSDDYQYPISVDPEVRTVIDSDLVIPSFPVKGLEGTNWISFENPTSHFTVEKSYYHPSENKYEQYWRFSPFVQVAGGENVGVQYETQGESSIYEATVGARAQATASERTQLEFENHAGGVPNNVVLGEDAFYNPGTTLCAQPGFPCNSTQGTPGNRVRFITIATATDPPETWHTEILGASVQIAQSNGPIVAFNTETESISAAANRHNVLYGSGSWLGPASGAFEVGAHDPGVGVSYASVIGGGFSLKKPLYEEDRCAGVQCNEDYSTPITYNKTMADGEDPLEFRAEDAVGFSSSTTKTIKVDSTPPRAIKIAGMAEEGAEISPAPHELTISATDGTAPIKSSGMKSLAVAVDGGQEVVLSGASCGSGECTASAKWTLHAETLAEGMHSLIVTATDNAQNVSATEFTFAVRHASPVAVGPGEVDPTTGQFSMNATDVDLGSGSGVARTYQSRDLTAGAEGPLGPQWAIGLGGSESLTLMSNGMAELTAASGGRTTFVRNQQGEFTSPAGDGNLKLEAHEKVAGKGITEYILSNAKAGTKTVFKQPGSEVSTMSFVKQFGQEAPQLSVPVADATDAYGNIWVSDFGNSRIAKFSATGLLLGTYGGYGSGDGQLMYPWGVAVNQANSNVYVTDQGNHRIVEFSSNGSFIRTFGWGVSDGKAELQTCTTGCKASITGSGDGQFSTGLVGVSVDSSGKVWVADFGNNRVQTFTETGAFVQKFGTEGTGNGQFKGPHGIAFSGGNVYVTDSGNNRVEEFSTTGAYIAKFGTSGSGNGQFTTPDAITSDSTTGDLYVADYGNDRVQEFTSSGAYVARIGSSGSGPGQFVEPTGVALSPSGHLFAVDYATHRIEEWARPTWLPTIAEGPVAAGTTTFAYRAVEIEGRLVVEPTEALAPVPAGVTCGAKISELTRGCRALTFNYAESTTATGEKMSEWGDYTGRLTRVEFTAWDPAKGMMSTTVVAQYSYDKQGRLRAEWDPRISPALKTTYGYDAEGHLTAITRTGQESWALLYGTIPGDPSTGRLLKATQAPASAALWAGDLPSSTVAPKITGTPVVGSPLTVSTGTWSGHPVAYAFEWKQCDSAGGNCTPILGATNSSYTPVESDIGHTIVASVRATSGGGAVAASSAVVGPVSLTTEYALPAGSSPQGITAGPDGKVWFTESGSNRIGKITTSGSITEVVLPAGSSPSAITVGGDNKLWFTDHGTSKVAKSTTGGAITEYALPAGSAPYGLAKGSDGNVWVADYAINKITKVTSTGTLTNYALPAGSSPYAVAAGPDGNIWFTEAGTGKIGKITTAGAVTEYATPAGTSPYGITAGPDGNLWFTSNGSVGKVGKITTGGVVTMYSLPVGVTPSGIAAGADGNLWITSTAGHLIKVTPAGVSNAYTLSTGASPITSGPDGNLWFGLPSSSKIDKIIVSPTEGAFQPQPGLTIAYNVPLSGTKAPYEMGLNQTTGKPEPERWGQTDDPTYATAIFPPDEPQGWPATSYKRATVYYLDDQGRLVNTATPSGGISTREYNSSNAVVRSLSAGNRAAALKESNSAEVSKKLDSETAYSPDGIQPIETLGPEHTVKLPDGSEASARNHARMFYDEGAPQGEAHGLITKSTEGALLVNGEEKDVRTTTTSYSGQGGLGWTLRKPTSTVTDPSGSGLVHKTVYDSATGNVVETRSPGGNSETVYPPAFASAFAGEGSGNGQLNHPESLALDASGNIWVVDENNNRVEKFSASGAFIAAYGSAGSGNLQFKHPWGIAINQTTGNVYVTDKENNRVQELSSSGAFVAAFGTTGSGALNEPIGVALDGSGNVWVSDWAHNRIVEYSSTGTFIREAGTAGAGNGQLSGPDGIAISEGTVYVADSGNGRVEQFSTSGSYLGQFGSKGTGAGQFNQPIAIAANPSTGTLYISDTWNNRVEEFSPAGRFLAQWATWSSSHPFYSPSGLAVGTAGQLYVSDLNADKVSSWTPPEAGAAHLTYGSQFGSSGSGNGQFSTPIASAIDGQGNIWVTDYGNSRIEKFSSQGAFVASYGTAGSGNGQFSAPGGVDINQSTGNVYISDAGNHRIQELSSTGAFVRTFGTSGSGALTNPGGVKIDSAGNVWVADMSANRIVEFSSTGTFIAAYGSEGSGQVQFKRPVAIAFSGENLYVTDVGNHRVQELTNKGAFLRQFGAEGEGSGEMYAPEGIAADSAGNLYVTDAGAGHVEEFSPTGVYRATFSTKGTGSGQLKEPLGNSIDAAGNMYVVDAGNNRVEKWNNGNPAVHDTKTIYYSTGANSEYPQCGGHPEWANLECQIEPVAQPKDGSLSLPVTTLTYNVWNELELNSEKIGSTTRTTKETYDAAGRPLTSEVASTADVALPKVTNEYSAENGALVKQSTTVEGHTTSITSVFNTLGQLTSYTDADSNTSKYTYDIDGRVEEVKDGKGSQIYSYDATTGNLTKLLDSAAGAFTATYDVEGHMTAEGYPNGMSASYKLNAIGEATQIEYVKTTHCSSNCTWFSDVIAPSIHGQVMTQASTLSGESYSYDALGRLTKAQETPAGQGCTTRVYAYDEESNRTSSTTNAPGAEGKCTTEGGTPELHVYDEAGRLMDSGTTYDALGNITSLPAGDAGGQALTQTYYADSQVQTQIQNGETIKYSYDPAGRTRETVSSGKTSSTVISHYSGPGQALAWTSAGGESWSRNIPGIDGGLGATQANGGTPVLQLHDLQGNIVATAAISETETKLLSTYNSTEFGVPTTANQPKYSWLGHGGLASEMPWSGVTTMNGASYVPQISRNLQVDAIIPPGAFPNGSDPGRYVAHVSAKSITAADAIAMQVFQEVEAARQRAAAEAAERMYRECIESGACGEGSEIDPGGCTGVGGLGERTSWDSRWSMPYLNITCHHANPNGFLSICISKVYLGHISSAFECTEWTEIKRAYANGKPWVLLLPGFECTVGQEYVVSFGYFAIPMRRPEWHYGKVETCHPDGKEYYWKAFVEAAHAP